MYQIKSIVLSLAMLSCFSCSRDFNSVKPAEYVNPFIGASTDTHAAGVYHGLGKTFPGAAYPFGAVQVSPNTITGGDNGSGYSYEHKTIEGFAFTQMSGVGWYGDLGNLLVMPTVGKMYTNSGKEDGIKGYRTVYDKQSEKASAGYYSVFLPEYGVRSEASVLEHSGILRFTFPQSKESRVQIDLARRVGGTSTLQSLKVVDDHTIQGFMECPPSGGGWGNGDGNARYTVYFYAQFSRPLSDFGFWSADIPDGVDRKREFIESDEFQHIASQAKIIKDTCAFKGKHIGFFANFETEENEQILFKSGISYVSIDGARRNLEAEIADWNFEQVREKNLRQWNNALSAIEIDGGTDEQKRIFYTALYHTMIDPRKFVDVDGNYVGGDGKIHSSTDFTKRTIFSGWDTYRSQMPLQSIINPDVVNDLLMSLLTLAEESDKGYYERFEMLNAYSGCMLGNPAISVLADAWAKGIFKGDKEKAFAIADNTSRLFGNGTKGYAPNSISKTLEYSYTEWCMSRMAMDLGKTDDVAHYSNLSRSYKNLYDKEKHAFRPRMEDGSFVEWPSKGKLQEEYGCTECNELQQGWFVPHDIEGMTELMGGVHQTIADLDTMFCKTPNDFLWNDYYNHANEPVHHVPFLYNRLGEPWKTQYWTRYICENAYHDSVDGLVGNEDAGQMSAWYILASCGLHPVCPGDTRYEITAPLFNEVTIKVGDNKTFKIKAINNSPTNTYIQAARLNGKEHSQCFLDYHDIMDGGILELEMGNIPNRFWGI